MSDSTVGSGTLPILPTPGAMDRAFARDDRRNGTLTLAFSDAGHLCDAINHAEKIGRRDELARALLRLVTFGLGCAVPQPGDEASGQPATPGAAVKLDIHPDGFRDPDFLWLEERDGRPRMAGGLIFHRSQGEWGIHT